MPRPVRDAASAKTRFGARPSANRVSASWPTTEPSHRSTIGWKNGVKRRGIDHLLERGPIGGLAAAGP